ncbi:hypothetical protein [Shewanella chilikensis]|uniref:hypothetical protein n=1 Tax=Shewanella chilikensis TaxID=558541 RepID=UPI003004618C
MQELNFIQSVQERDIDLMLLEEFHTSTAFCNWLASRVYEFPHAVEFVGAWHSVIHNQYGESDLVLIFKANDGSHQAILIENKIDATPQQQQGLRYRYRGEHGIEQGHWVDFRTCLLAPQKYLASNNEPYDKTISYEEIMAYFVAQGGWYRARLMAESISKQRRGYLPSISPEVTEFARCYLEFAKIHHPELNPEPPKNRAAGHSWLHFYPLLPNKQIRIVHQLAGSLVKIMFLGAAEQLDMLTQAFGAFASTGLVIKRSGKSVVMELATPPIDPFKDKFEDVLPQVERAIAQAKKLRQMLIQVLADKGIAASNIQASDWYSGSIPVYD